MLLGLTSGASFQVLHQPEADAADLFEFIQSIFPSAGPRPVSVPRKQLDLAFAVLLMRSSYNAADALDFMPMDKFQIEFWKQRQAEQEGYFDQYKPLKVRQGDLTDPLFFDFISYTQYSVLGKEMPNGQQVFQEPCDTDDCDPKGIKTIRRDASIADNKLLPPRFYDRVGDNILRGLQEGFRDETFNAPPSLPPSASASQVVENLQKLLDIFVSRGFALKAQVMDVSIDSNDTKASFKVKAQGTANLWGVASLSFRRSPVVNDYIAMVLSAYLRQCGRQVTSFDLEYTDTQIEESWAFE